MYRRHLAGHIVSGMRRPAHRPLSVALVIRHVADSRREECTHGRPRCTKSCSHVVLARETSPLPGWQPGPGASSSPARTVTLPE